MIEQNGKFNSLLSSLQKYGMLGVSMSKWSGVWHRQQVWHPNASKRGMQISSSIHDGQSVRISQVTVSVLSSQPPKIWKMYQSNFIYWWMCEWICFQHTTSSDMIKTMNWILFGIVHWGFGGLWSDQVEHLLFIYGTWELLPKDVWTTEVWLKSYHRILIKSGNHIEEVDRYRFNNQQTGSLQGQLHYLILFTHPSSWNTVISMAFFCKKKIWAKSHITNSKHQNLVQMIGKYVVIYIKLWDFWGCGHSASNLPSMWSKCLLHRLIDDQIPRYFVHAINNIRSKRIFYVWAVGAISTIGAGKLTIRPSLCLSSR